MPRSITLPDTAEKLGPVAILLIVFLVFLPKGGVAVAGIPLTWGYLILGLSCVYLTLRMTLIGRVRLHRLISWMATLPFLLNFMFTVGLLGITPGYTGYSISFLVTFAVLPLFFFLSCDHYFTDMRVRKIAMVVARGLPWVAAYGVALFILGFLTGKLWDIPMITSTAFEHTSLADKDNLRGDLFKLVSTYANGNIYGACMAMLIPFTSRLVGRWKSWILKLSLLLTLSRTAWVALILVQIYSSGKGAAERRSSSFRNIVAAVVISAVAITVGLVLLGAGSHFIFDPTLGGRLSTFELVRNAEPVATHAFPGIAEAIYPSIAYHLGWAGLATFLLAIGTPLFIAVSTGALSDPLRRDLAAGMCIYLVVAMSDGALLLIPVMAIFWCIASVILEPMHTRLPVAISNASPRAP